MSCYMRQMTWLFEALGLPYDKDHRKLLDNAIREELALPAEFHCPEVWSAIKALTDDERAALTSGLHARLGD
jgi:hypothetical protein